MSILTGPEIERVYRDRATVEGIQALPYIDVSPWPEHPAGPNSLDVRLAPELKVYALHSLPPKYTALAPSGTEFHAYLSTRRPTPTIPLTIPEDGFVLQPGVLYLGSTYEYIECHGLVPWIDGRSSTGRLSVAIHKTAGRADDGWSGQLTLEISCVHPVEIFPYDRIAQLTFFTLTGERRPYQGRYLNSCGPVESRMHETEGVPQ